MLTCLLPKRICPRFLKSGICRRQKCKWAHSLSELQVAPSEGGNDGTGEDNDNPVSEKDYEKRFGSWKSNIPSNLDTMKPLGGRMSTFFQEGRKLIEADENFLQMIILHLSEEGGLRRVEELVELNLPLMADSMRQMFFFAGIIPFLETIAHPRVLSSFVLEGPLRTIYNFIFGYDGQRGCRFLSSIADILGASLGSTEGNTARYLEVSLRFFRKLIDLNWTAFIHEPFAAFIHEQFRLLALRFEDFYIRLVPYDFSYSIHRSHTHLERMRRRLDFGSTLPFAYVAGLPLTGVPPGGRHDNDHSDICDVKILPTSQEIVCPQTEYLPTYDPRQWYLGGVDGLLDRNFRLFREDTVGQLRDTVYSLLGAPSSRPYKRDNLLRTYLYPDVQVIRLHFERLAGFQFRIEFPQPPPVRQMGLEQRRDWWTFSGRLQRDSLLCLVDSQFSVMFCVAVGSDPYVALSREQEEYMENESLWRNPEKASAVLGLLESDSENIRYVFNQYMSHGTFHMVEFPGFLLPAFRPTLLALQKMKRSADLPFPEFLAPPSLDLTSGYAHMPPPEYALEPGFRFNLRCLLKNKADLELIPGQPFNMRSLQENTTLDNAQAVSLVHALQSRIGLIQGPPGTGKSFTGISLLKVLIDNKYRGMGNIGPVICVCYTNHALDQLLEDLLEQGISGIIRIGSRSKSQILEPYNLRMVSKNRSDKTEFEKNGQYRLFRRLERLKDDFLKLRIGDNIYADRVASYLADQGVHHYNQLFGADRKGILTAGMASQVFRNWLGSGNSYLQSPRPIAELNYTNVHHMSKEERELLYASWVEGATMDIQEQALDVAFSHNDARSDFDKIRGEVDRRSLRDADVIGVTTSGLANNFDMLRKLEAKVVLCEEAGEVLEPHLLTALLPSVEHAILIGDHLQLRPQIQNYQLSRESEEGKPYSLDVSLFERLVNPDIGTGRPIPYSTLETQRRMHPSISQLIRETLYPQLKDDRLVYEYPPVAGMGKRLFWFDHRMHESQLSVNDSTYWNEHEIDVTVALVHHLVKQGTYNGDDIAVLTPYLGQLNRLRAKFSESMRVVLGDRDQYGLERAGFDDYGIPGTEPDALRLATIDNFQGEEAKVIVISLVRSNEQNRCGFLRTENRINVLLSRAQHGMYIIGNSETSRTVPMWDAVIGILQRNGNIGTSLELQMTMSA